MYKIKSSLLRITSSKAVLADIYLSKLNNFSHGQCATQKTSHYISKQLCLSEDFSFYELKRCLSEPAMHCLFLCLLQFHGVYLQDIHALLTSTLPCCLSARAFFLHWKRKKRFFLLLLESTKMISFKITIHSILYIPYTRNAVCPPPFPVSFSSFSPLVFFALFPTLSLLPLLYSLFLLHLFLRTFDCANVY